ncbi:partner and localizer of BRCA2 isoform X1 [Brachyistius frenatus]|uniref:partner and localizer of BRCA2 isoform X1 n=1 Tax=Brachyistius frenatus TaxID=100188 RepID=UPI0037E71C8F
METNGGDAVHREEQLKTTLHCDDKEKLRRKLAQLQREYLRTAQRLQRAERLDAVQRHVRSTVTQQDQQDQRHVRSTVTQQDQRHVRSTVTQQDQQDQRHVRSTVTQQDQRHPELTSNPCLIQSIAVDVPQCQGHSEGPADCDNSRRRQVIRFLLPADAASPQTPGPSDGTPAGHRPSPALRLRSRRSRLRWERRSAEVGMNTDNSEEAPEQSELTGSTRTAGEEKKAKSKGTDVLNESEELFSGTDSESPSLLLTHWNTDTREKDGKEMQGHQEDKTELRAEGEKESESTSILLTSCNPAITTEERGQDGTQSERREEVMRGEDGDNNRGQSEISLCEKTSDKHTGENASEKIESEKNPDETVGMKEEKTAVSLLDSCTLVEGLLFPAEYYVRTTRRMTLSRSQPDMQAVILSQLSMGRPRRSRGRGPSRSTHSDQRTHPDFSSATTAPTAVIPLKLSHVQAVDAEQGQSARGMSDPSAARQIESDAGFSTVVTAARPAGGRRGKRGRGRGRPRTPRPSLSLDTHQLGSGQTSDDPQPTNTPISSSESPHGTDGPGPRLTPGETISVPDEPQPAFTRSTSSLPSSGVDGALPSSACKYLEKVCPVFLSGSSHRNRSSSSWRSLLLPSSPASQTSPLPSLLPGSLVNGLTNLDIHQDFHLPDDQFASLKLHKLRQVATGSEVEHFSSPSYNTRSSNRRYDPHHNINNNNSSSEPVMPLSLPLSLTPTIADSPHPNEEQQAATQSVDLQDLSTEDKLTDEMIGRSLTEEPSDREAHKESRTENLHMETRSSSTESVSVVEECEDKSAGHEVGTPNCHSQSNTHTNINSTNKPHLDFTDRPAGKVNDYITGHSDDLIINQPASEKQMSIDPEAEDQAPIEALYIDCPLQETPEEPWNNCTALNARNDMKAQGESPVQQLDVKTCREDSEEPSEPSEPRTRLTTDRLSENNSKCFQLLLTSQASALDPFITPHLPSSAVTSSPPLPSLGSSPHPVTGSRPQITSPRAPSLTLPPPPHSPSTQALSPPALSPCPSVTYPPPSPTDVAPSARIRTSSEPPGDQCHRVEPAATCPTPASIQLQGSGGQRTEETAEKYKMRHTHTLKAAAGGCLVDACCVPGSAGGLCVAAAGTWAVCLWSQTSASDWSLIHTWTFDEPVINVFPVPDAAALMCVTLGQLEIREVRTLSCSSFTGTLLCQGLVQAAVGVSKSRVVTSSPSATGSTLQVFTLTDGSSSPGSQPLVSPGVCVGALAAVDGLSDALIGTDEGGRLFIWNLKTGQLLRRVLLGGAFSHTACLRGYASCGVLFVLLQHQFLSSPEEEEKEGKLKDGLFPEEDTKTALFSLVTVNPLSGRSVPATRLYPPEAWSGRLCEADARRCSVVGLSQSGCVCVWELGPGGASRMVRAPESEGWQLARWGGADTLVTGHHNGDVTLHCC